MVFKCKNCGGNVIYSPERKGMFCPFCESENSEEKKEFPDQDMKICPNCGGEVPVQEHTSASQCPYCDNYLIFDQRIEGDDEPKIMIPFRFGKEKCKESIREKFKKCLFAPTDFLSEARLNGMQGTYVPFWFFDYDVNCDYSAEGTRVKSWTTGNTQYTETSYYNIFRNMDADFENIPVDASVDMPDDVMDLMEPYNYSELMPFKPEYLSGFYAEKYNMTADIAQNRAKQKMNEDVGQMLSQSYSGYSHVTVRKNNIQVKREENRYGLLPVWKYIYRYQDKDYPFYVNGQNGKIVGAAPISKKKVWSYAGTLWLCLTLILGMINGIIYLV